MEMTSPVLSLSKTISKTMSPTFLQFNEGDIFDNPGKVTANMSKAFAENEFEKYRVVQDRLFESDFDHAVKKLQQDTGKK